MSKKKIAIILALMLVLDQVVKIWVKTNMTINESITVFSDWFFIRFLENPGAAYGMELGGDYGKLILSLFRIIAIAALSWYLFRLSNQRKTPKGVVWGFTLILAGAVGNLIDSMFYGMLFSESTWMSVATFLPEGGGYSSFLHGEVVDMLYFPLVSFVWPEWMPFVGDDDYTFFSHIFNIADSYISIGVIYLILFQRKFFK